MILPDNRDDYRYDLEVYPYQYIFAVGKNDNFVIMKSHSAYKIHIDMLNGIPEKNTSIILRNSFSNILN